MFPETQIKQPAVLAATESQLSLPLWRLATHRAIQLDELQLAFSRPWLYAQLRKTRSYLARNRPVNRTCVIAGNGPSLNDVDWSRIDGLDVFASNYAFLHEDLRSRVTYLSIVNPWVASQAQSELNNYDGILFFPYYLSYWIAASQNRLLVDCHSGYACATQPNDKLSTRSTVSYFNMQLAMCLGYKNILMVGFDHYYQQPPQATEGTLLQAGNTDPNHFSTGYFADKYWQAADTTKMEFVYTLANQAFSKLGTKVVNCSTKSALVTFDRLTLSEALEDIDSSQHRAPHPAAIPRQTNLVQLASSFEEMTSRSDRLPLFALFVVLLLVSWLLQEAAGNYVLSAMTAIAITSTCYGYLLFHRRRQRAELEQNIEAALSLQPQQNVTVSTDQPANDS